MSTTGAPAMAKPAKKKGVGKAKAKKQVLPAGKKLKRSAKSKRSIKDAKLKKLTLILCIFASAAMLVIAGLYANRMLEKRTYKLLYPEEILSGAKEYSLDPYLVAAVIQTESSNRANVVSNKGAVGLMQIMPKTGEWIAEKIGMSDYSEDMLKEPYVNIRFGCWYLRYLSDKYGGIERSILSAYNAGPGNVDKWLSDPRYGDGKRLLDIPYKETREYVEKVSSAKEKYRELYEKELGK